MIGETGFFCLVLALFCALIVLFLQNKVSLKYSVLVMWLAILASFLLLMTGYITSDFSISNVYQNSHSMKPLIYKITGTWGNHEGSMLLALLILCTYLLHFSWKSEPDYPTYTRIIQVQTAIILGFMLFVIFTSNPFLALSPAPQQGVGLNPLLQDIGLAIHPPILYLGYLGYSIVFAIALAVLLGGELRVQDITRMRRYAMVSWSCLSLGVGLGSWWAYRELGWGGYWFWDPVENASFMPWLVGTALLHSLIVAEKKQQLILWTLLLGLLAFSFSMVGLFLVRSGIVTSVHAFASDPTRGIYILAFISLLIGTALTVFAYKARYFKSQSSMVIASKEGAIVINNMLFMVLCGVVFIGTLYPILAELFADVLVSVGAPYFNQTFNPIAIVTLILGMAAPYIPWGKYTDNQILIKGSLLVISIIACVAAMVYGYAIYWISAFAIAVGALLILSMLLLWALRFLSAKITLPARFYAMILAHMAIGMAIIAMASLSEFSREKELLMEQNERVSIAGYTLKLDSMALLAKDNYLARQGHFSLFDQGNAALLASLTPEIRHYPARAQNTTESAIYYTLLSNIYVSLGDVGDGGKFAVRIYYRPLVNLLWLAALMLFVSGLLTLKRKS